uniref:Uncharacterized protein n=1 Tax=Globodera pallida TaxID=36090 RepID=A0A183BVY7_GLOPA
MFGLHILILICFVVSISIVIGAEQAMNTNEGCGCANEQTGTMLLVCIFKCWDNTVKTRKQLINAANIYA